MAISDDRKSLSIAFLSNSDQYATFIFHKMAAGGHFGWPKINTQLWFIFLISQNGRFWMIENHFAEGDKQPRKLKVIQSFYVS